jgi:hypothetical protein
VLDYGHLIYQVSFGAGMDLVYLVQINLSLPKIKQKPHKVYQYKKAIWEKIEPDLQTTHSHMKENQNHMDANNHIFNVIPV